MPGSVRVGGRVGSHAGRNGFPRVIAHGEIHIRRKRAGFPAIRRIAALAELGAGELGRDLVVERRLISRIVGGRVIDLHRDIIGRQIQGVSGWKADGHVHTLGKGCSTRTHRHAIVGASRSEGGGVR